MDALDRAVIQAFADRVLVPARLAALFVGYLARSVEGGADRQTRIDRLKAEIPEASGAKARLIRLVASGALSDDDPELNRELREAEERRRRAADALRLLEAQAKADGPRAHTPAKIARVGAAIRQALLEGDPAFRRAYLRLFVGQVEVEDEKVTIRGPTDALVRAAAVESPESLTASGSQFRSKWRRKGNCGATVAVPVLLESPSGVTLSRGAELRGVTVRELLRPRLPSLRSQTVRYAPVW